MEGVAILSRYPFDYYEARHLEARAGFYELGFPRVSVMGEFQVPGIGRVRVVTLHLAWSRTKDEVRKAQLQETLTWIAKRDHVVPADVIILGGDFNANPGWPELAVLRDPLPWSGLVFENHNSRVPTQGKNGTMTRRLDYIFVAARDRDIEFLGEALLWTDGIEGPNGASRYRPSDHLPLLHVYVIGQP